jgi:hypothetical protein
VENNNLLKQDYLVVPTLEALDAVEDMVNALDAKVDYLDRRIGEAEARLEEIAAEQD